MRAASIGAHFAIGIRNQTNSFLLSYHHWRWVNILKHFFDNHELNLTLELFLRMLHEELGDHLLSVVLYGSILFDDLAPGYGDLDFLAVLDSDLSEEQLERLIELRRPLRQQNFGLYAKMLEGAYLPKAMLDPTRSGRGLWWGTSRERALQRNELGAFVLRLTKDMGITIWGNDLRAEIPAIRHDEMFTEAEKWCHTVEEHGVGGGLHSIDWLLSNARMIRWLQDGQFCSKSDAADWGAAQLHGDWRLLLPKAKRLRREPSLASSPEVKEWLIGLTDPIRESARELRLHLYKQRDKLGVVNDPCNK
ncbi:MAG: aminoglycoside adenylyltransferase domain-containing protein [Bacillota bacterium]